jgi:hypothetical protein
MRRKVTRVGEPLNGGRWTKKREYERALFR